MRKVETSKPIVPVVKSAKRMEMAELMMVFPSSNVHSSRLPCFLTAKHAEIASEERRSHGLRVSGARQRLSAKIIGT